MPATDRLIHRSKGAMKMTQPIDTAIHPGAT